MAAYRLGLLTSNNRVIRGAGVSLRIVVCVKYVPDATGDRHFAEDWTLDRDDVDGLLSELDEYAVEQALQIAESAREAGEEAEITVLTVGPEDAADALRKALSMGADKAVHVEDDDLHGTDALGTSLVLAKAIEHIGYDLVVCGMASTDGAMGVLPAMLAERLSVPQATLLSELTVAGGTVTGRRDGDAATERLSAQLPAVVSVTDQSGEARYPSFKGIMAAKKKPVEALDLEDLDLDAERVGLAGSRTEVISATERPARTAGEIVTDEGEGAGQLAGFLAGQKFI
jgi:electron transfer flavoprotein beta subunit